MRICPKCKNVIDNDHAKFCKKCGCSLEPILTKEQEKTNSQFLKREKSIISRRDSDSGIILDSTSAYSSSKHNHDGIIQECYIHVDNKKNQQNSNIDKKITMDKAIKICFSKYVKFDGKASRSEYWYFWLFCFCMEIIPVIFAFIIDKEEISLSLLAVSFIYSIVSFLPMLSAAVRRLHDVGKSGVYLLVSFIPMVGGFILLYFLCEKGNE